MAHNILLTTYTHLGPQARGENKDTYILKAAPGPITNRKRTAANNRDENREPVFLEPVPSEPIVWNRQPNSLTVLLSVLCGVAHARTLLVSSSDCSKHGN